MIHKLKRVLTSIDLFSRLILQLPLRAYQVTPADAVIEACLHGSGLEFLWVFPRQSGKDEAIAQLCVFLLTLFQRVEVSIVHVYPTAQQAETGIARLERRLANRLTGRAGWARSQPTRRGLGKAQVAFFSGHPQARAEGATANLLLIVNEVQDQLEPIVERRFTPMRASTNASALYVGTVRTTADYLWRVKTRLEALQTSDGVQRVFMVTPDQIGAENPHYAAFVAGQVRLKGRHHPSVKTELFNEPLDAAQGLFPERRRALMQGSHPRLVAPIAGEVYVAAIDVGGQDEAATEPGGDPAAGPRPGRDALDNPARDYTVCSIARVAGAGPPGPTGAGESFAGALGPRYEVVDVFVDHGSRHFRDAPGRPALFSRLLAYLAHWRVAACVCDSSGVGQGLADALSRVSQRPVLAYDFAGTGKKARLGNDFLALIETGRFKYWSQEYEVPRTGYEAGSKHQPSPPLPTPQSSPPSIDAWWFFEQCRFCSYQLADGQSIERGLRWGVPATARTTTPDGATVPVHDDRLLSAALLAELERARRSGEVFLSAGHSTVITTPRAQKEDWT
jgi:hypothetical protein